MNKLTDSKEEVIFRELVKEPINYPYVERGNNFFQITDKDGETFIVQVKRKVPKKSKNRPRGWEPKGLSEII